jgi:hypothetical protein
VLLLRDVNGKLIGFVASKVPLWRAFAEDLKKEKVTHDEAISMGRGLTLNRELRKVYVRWPHRGAGAARAAGLFISEVMEGHILGLSAQLDDISAVFGLDFDEALRLEGHATGLNGDAFALRVLHDLERLAQACRGAGPGAGGQESCARVGTVVDSFGRGWSGLAVRREGVTGQKPHPKSHSKTHSY